MDAVLVATIGIFALIALVLVLLRYSTDRFKSTLTGFLAWFGFLGASGLVASPVDLIRPRHRLVR